MVYQISGPSQAEAILKPLNPSECLVFVDLNIDGFDGLEFYLEYLKPRSFTSLVLSSSDNPIDIDRCYGVGFSGYFSKKSSMKEYTELMRTILSYQKETMWGKGSSYSSVDVKSISTDKLKELKEENISLKTNLDKVMSVVSYPNASNSILTRVSNPDDFYAKLLSNYSMGIYVYDVEINNNIYINSRYTDITGYSIDDLLEFSSNGTFLNLFHPDELDRVLDYMNNVRNLKVGEFSQINYRFKNSKGEWLNLLSQDTPFSFNDDGSMRQFIGNFLVLR
jgi:PAS domain S-box-containing protein